MWLAIAYLVGVLAAAGFINGFCNKCGFSIPTSAWYSWYGLFYAVGRIVGSVLIHLSISKDERGNIEC